MKYQIEKTLLIKCTLDSSELTMFNKGGRHQVELENLEELNEFNKVILSIQLEKGQQSMFDHTFTAGQEHRKKCDKGFSSVEEFKQRL
jgi:hypothetical protein